MWLNSPELGPLVEAHRVAAVCDPTALRLRRDELIGLIDGQLDPVGVRWRSRSERARTWAVEVGAWPVLHAVARVSGPAPEKTDAAECGTQRHSAVSTAFSTSITPARSLGRTVTATLTARPDSVTPPRVS